MAVEPGAVGAGQQHLLAEADHAFRRAREPVAQAAFALVGEARLGLGQIILPVGIERVRRHADFGHREPRLDRLGDAGEQHLVREPRRADIAQRRDQPRLDRARHRRLGEDDDAGPRHRRHV